jgi:hypothetical protein
MTVDSVIPLTSEAFEEIKAKLEVLKLDVRITYQHGEEILILDGIGLTKEKDRDITCYMVYQGQIIRKPKETK